MQQTEANQKLIEKNKKLWKVFGRQTKEGKELYNMYNLGQKPKINYPKLKPKSQKQIDQQIETMISIKQCPQKTKIDYPQLPKKEGPKYHPVDFIPKRKNELVIRQQIDEQNRRRAKDIPANRGVDRAKLVKSLQDKFKMKGGILPKDATLPGLEKMTYDQEKIKQQAKQKIDRKAQSFSNPIKNQKQNKEQCKDFNDELGKLFDEIVIQIEERQSYLEKLQHLNEPKMKDKIKNQIAERIAELQRITELKAGKK